MADSPLSYDRVDRQLASVEIESTPAEVHGVLCGLLCAGCKEAQSLWLKELFTSRESADLLVGECRASLEQLYGETAEEMDGPGLGFTPFFPDENQPLRVRAAAVSDWCQGFLYGVGLAGVAIESELSDGVREALKDLSEISRLDLDDLVESEEAEADLMEVSEFLWVAAMLLHAERVVDPTERS